MLDRKIPACGALSGVGSPAALAGWLRRARKGGGLTVLSTCASRVLDEAAPIVFASEFAADRAVVVQQIGSLGGFRLLFASFWVLLAMLCVIISNIEGCAHF